MWVDYSETENTRIHDNDSLAVTMRRHFGQSWGLTFSRLFIAEKTPTALQSLHDTMTQLTGIT